MIPCCREHLEIAIDDYIDQTNEPPEIVFVRDRLWNGEIQKSCLYCDALPEYVVLDAPRTDEKPPR